MTVPTGASEAVAVVTDTDSARAQREESASPLKPNVATLSRSLNEVSLEVWCLSAARQSVRWVGEYGCRHEVNRTCEQHENRDKASR